MVAKTTGLGAPGMQSGDPDGLEVERMPMGCGGPRAILAVHSVFDSTKPLNILARVAAGRHFGLTRTTGADSRIGRSIFQMDTTNVCEFI